MFELTEFQHHIRLVLEDKALDNIPHMWFLTVKNMCPKGILNSVEVMSDDGSTKPVSMRHYIRKETNEYVYEIPLKRDLTEKEGEIIVLTWDGFYEHGDYVIETSTPTSDELPDLEMIIKDNSLNNIAEEFAKESHARWLAARVKNGWRYGIKYSMKLKTHPMIRPWEQLPEEYKNIDIDLPGIFLGILNKQ